MVTSGKGLVMKMLIKREREREREGFFLELTWRLGQNNWRDTLEGNERRREMESQNGV